MSITYPLTLPTITGLASISLRTRNVTAISESPFSLTQQVIAHTGQRWEAAVTLPAMGRASAEAWLAFLISLKGHSGTFLMGDPFGGTARGSAGGTPLVAGASQTGSVLALDGATPSQTDWLKAGDYIQLGTGSTSRLHKVLADADSDGSGNVSLDIWPNITSSPADNAVVVVSNAVGIWRLASPVLNWDTGTMRTYGITFDAIEART